MTQFSKALRDSQQMTSNAHSAALSALNGGEMMKAASDVIAARLEIMAAGLANPGQADLTEMSLMSSEKVEALSASAATLSSNMGELGGRLSRNAMEELALASRAASSMATAGTPAGVAQVQFNYAVGWWSRAASQMLTLNTEMLKAQADAMKPIHATAVANAKRLKR
ncbi:phasin family protein [Brevundimonas variabilis]|uniref:Phasin domain-containing protein n=1 Tax=Brevundimonas variabilis TaxID=74312 RepID=A0A7W9CH28_9CAUL|nr:phasin [Brevundimonas variabilis]MBB5745248.1 hypothetical protein [Brevundimonas variabilis]